MIKIYTKRGYFEYFFSICHNYTNYKEAYEATEQYLNKCLPDAHRYESYEAFRAAKSRYLKTLKLQK